MLFHQKHIYFISLAWMDLTPIGLFSVLKNESVVKDYKEVEFANKRV